MPSKPSKQQEIDREIGRQKAVVAFVTLLSNPYERDTYMKWTRAEDLKPSIEIDEVWSGYVGGLVDLVFLCVRGLSLASPDAEAMQGLDYLRTISALGNTCSPEIAATLASARESATLPEFRAAVTYGRDVPIGAESLLAAAVLAGNELLAYHAEDRFEARLRILGQVLAVMNMR